MPKVVYHGCDNTVPASSIRYSDTFMYEGHHYMRVRLRREGLSYHKPQQRITAVNLKSGTTRLIMFQERVEPTRVEVHAYIKPREVT